MFPPAGSGSVQTCGLVLVLAVLLQSICVAVTYIYFYSELQQLRDSYSRSNIACLLGEDPGMFLKTVEKSDLQNVVDESDPCWHIKWQLQKLTQKMLMKNYQADISSAVKGEMSQFLLNLTGNKQRSHLPSQRIAAHLTGNNRKDSSATENTLVRSRILGQKIQTWEPSKGFSLLQNVNFKHGELVILKNGFYYIYSQTYFRYRGPDRAREPDLALMDSSKTNKQMVQYVYKVARYPEPILLMKSAKTTCWSKNAEYGIHSIYQGGVFELKYNDRVFVSVSNMTLIDMDKEASFFGAFLVS
ncbi:tumor necrosis factor ligand superfamily member 10 [Rhinatrema bivittatum]|uniref:tumor necrosis factor ligand superfamily member 10 n=1 Tax=Rhinatrema bivittatum TaxID=194408 RepID=UPI00112ACCBA|nr:tumor necrosis factor ligand superfamily member 10 [Rhinatrema bivittatum]